MRTWRRAKKNLQQPEVNMLIHLTSKTAADVATHIRQLLTDRKFSVASCHAFNERCEDLSLKTGRVLVGEVVLRRGKDWSIWFNTDEYQYWFDTGNATFSFRHSGFKVTYRAPAGNLCAHLFEVETPDAA